MNEILSNYILGFLACDGYLDKNEITFGLDVQKRDKLVLDLFCERFGGSIEKPRMLKGREYLRARHHSKSHWRWLIDYFGGRLKEQRVWPATVTPSFVAGCMDANGCFLLHHGYPAGEFQHASTAFRQGLLCWLETAGIHASERKDRPVICFPASSCRKLAELWPKWGALARKQKIASYRPPLSKRWWTAEQLLIVQDRSLSQSEAAKLAGKTAQAVNLKRWRLANAASA